MTRSVAIDVFRIYVGAVLNQSLNHAQIAPEAGNVQRCTEIVRSCIYLSPKFNEDLDERCVTLT